MAHEHHTNDCLASTPTPANPPRQSVTEASDKLVWLITGTSSGLGLRLVASALARGDRVIATARSSSKLPSFQSIRNVYDTFLARADVGPPASGPSRTPGILDEHAQNLLTLQLDITSGETCLRQKVAEAASHWGRIDVLVNNAGLSYPGILEEGGCVAHFRCCSFCICLAVVHMQNANNSPRSSMLRAVFETNFFCTVDMTTASLPYIRDSKGWVVNIGSRSVWKAGTTVSVFDLVALPNQPGFPFGKSSC
jgi:NAD(P)-dependent dehydrogenase (short-subunit alcohol dehydrogenase family)